jgi:Trk K+ transport system NAD-binding subunit
MSTFTQGIRTRRNLRQLIKFFLILIFLVCIYSVVFHFLMDLEERNFSWLTGFYWTLTVMSTLGFGDITFTSDLGRFFSIVVLLSGVVFLLTLLPFTVIQLFYAPWIEAQAKQRAPKELPTKTKDHVVITSYDPVTIALIEKLNTWGQEYVLIVEDIRHALDLSDAGIRVALGNIDDPETYRRMQVAQAALVVATSRDEINVNIALTVREINEHVPILTTADSVNSVDILHLAGSTRTLQLYEILGRSLSTWTVGGDCRSNIIIQIDELVIAEFPALETPLVGKTLAESRIREDFGLSVVGIWERGQFIIPTAKKMIERTSVLVLAGSRENLAAFDDIYSFYHICHISTDPVLIVGGGRVGKAVAKNFKERKMPYLIIEKNPRHVEEDHYVVGDAADIRTLQKAWIENAPASVITTHDDATNIYLTKYLRGLRPGMQIISRANVDRNVSTLHRAGADFVMSYASLGANAIGNFLKNEGTLMLAEGMDVFRLKAPKSLVGKTLAQSKIREMTECTVVGIKQDGVMATSPDPQAPIQDNAELVLIGNIEGGKRFFRWIQKDL